MIVTDTQPRLDIHPEDVSVFLNSTVRVLCSTEVQANQLADFFRAAAVQLAIQRQQRSDRADRQAAERMNRANERAHRGWGRVLQGWPAVPTASHAVTDSQVIPLVPFEDAPDGAA